MNTIDITRNQGTISFKLVLVGESGVGKSSIIARYINDTFGTMYPEMGVFLTKIVSIHPDLPKINYEIWDTAGQEKYRSIAKLFYKDADMILIVFDLTRKFTFDEIKKYWVKEVINNADKEAMIAIVGNKSDLLSRIDDKEVENYINSIGCIYTKTSAKTNDGIQYLFDKISDELLRRKNMPVIEECIEKPLSLIEENETESLSEKIIETDMKNDTHDEIQIINGTEEIIKEELILNIQKQTNNPNYQEDINMNSRKITVESEIDKTDKQVDNNKVITLQRESPRKLSNGIHIDQEEDLKKEIIEEKSNVIQIYMGLNSEIDKQKEIVNGNNGYTGNCRTSSFKLDSRTSSFISKKHLNANNTIKDNQSVHSLKNPKSKCC